MKPNRQTYKIDSETIRNFRQLPAALLSPIRHRQTKRRPGGKQLIQEVDEKSFVRQAAILSPEGQARIFKEEISLKELKTEVTRAGQRALGGQSGQLARIDTSLRFSDVFDFDSPMASQASQRRQGSASRASTPAQNNRASGILRGSAMQQGSGEEEYGWTVEPGSSMQFALSPQFQKEDFDRDFYHMFLASNDTHKLDIDSWRATMSMSTEMFPNTSVLSKHAATSAFGAEQMKFNGQAYPTKRLQAYGKWYVSDKQRWQADFESKAGGVVPHDMLTKAQRERKRKLADQCATMEAAISKHDISYVYRNAIQHAVKQGDTLLGSRLPVFLQKLPLEKPEEEAAQPNPKMHRQNPTAMKALKRQPSRLKMAANSIKHGVQIAQVAERSQPGHQK